jgi:peptide/nickel transport system permease protein
MQLLRRAGQLIGVVLAVVLVVFGLIRLVPGDPALNILGTKATPEALKLLRAELGVDRPFLEQLGSTFGELVHGDLGTSLILRKSVAGIVVPALGVTLAVAALSIVISLLVGIPLGLLAGLKTGRPPDLAIRIGSVVLLATPTVFVALLLVLLIAVRAHLAPAGGWANAWPANFRFLWLPSCVLASFLTPVVTRVVRSSAREAAAEAYVEAAITRGLSPRRVALRHILPNSLLPVITVVGYSLSAVIGGAVIVESVFDLPGMGSTLVEAVGSRDFPVIQGVALVTAVMVVLINMVTDVVYGLVDPRIRSRS